MRKVILLLLINIFISCSGNSQSIDLNRTEGDLFTVECELNEKVKVPFIIDTGCTTTTIPLHIAMTLVNTGSLTEEDFIEERVYILADGSRGSSPVVKIKTLKIGCVLLEDVEVSIGMTKGASLLLGNNVLSKLRKVSIDYEKNTLNYEQD